MKSLAAPVILLALFLFISTAGTTLNESLVSSSTPVTGTSEQSAFERREAAYRANNLGVALLEQYKAKDAVDSFTRALEIKPDLLIARINLRILLTRTGHKEEGQRILQKFQEFKQSGAGTTIGTNYLEGGHYAEAVVSTGIEPELVDKRTPDVVFTDVTATALPPFRKLKI